VYGIIIAGWSSNSKYAFLGALRSTAQMISYEVSIGLIVISVLLCAGSLNFSEIVLAQQSIWYFIPLFPASLMFYISILAETNRAPFDLPEAEAELVAGYNVEYSAMGFALFFLGEYANMILMSGLAVIFFFGGWLPPFSFNFFF
jgi:NADH-quinone oxidoreductase subunit H